MIGIAKNRKFLVFSILLALLLCAAQVAGNRTLILSSLVIYLILVAWCCWQDYTLPILLFFVPWSTIMRVSPDDYSFYTFGLVLICLLSIIKRKLRFRNYQIISGLFLLFLSLFSKLLDGSRLTFDYIAFMMMLFLLPLVREETNKNKYDFYHLVIFLSVGAVIASLCAMNYADYDNIRKFIRVDTYSTIVRRCGFYRDPNFYVAQILAALGGALALTLQEKNRGKLIILGIVAVFLVYCGFLSGSKSFAIIIAVLLLLWFVGIFKMRGKAGLKVVLFICFVGIAIYIATSVLFSGLIQVLVTRLTDANDLNSFLTGRTDIWDGYLQEIFGNLKVFLIGRGFTNVWANGVASHNTIIQAVFQFGFIGAPVLAYWVVCFYRSSARLGKKTKEFGLHRLIVFVGFFMPWLAIDMLFFDEFFLFQWYMIVALAQFSDQSEMRETLVENGLPHDKDCS